MAAVVPDQGEVTALEFITKKVANADLKLRLFTNDETIDEDTVIGDLTECAAAGYAAITLTGASWTVDSVAGVSSATYAEQTFTLSASVTIYGWYITNNAGDKLLIAEKLATPLVIVDSGSVLVTPVLRLA